MIEDQTTLEFPHDGAATVSFGFEPYLVCCVASGPGGHPLRVLIDTGTDPSGVDLRLARRLALRTGGSGLGQGAASDSVSFTETVLPWLRLGDTTGATDAVLTIRNLFASALDLSEFPFPLDVVLGYNVLWRLVLRLDYHQRQIVFAHPDLGPPAVSPQGALLELTFDAHFPGLADLEIGGEQVGLTTIDTGSNAAITVGPGLAARIGLVSGGEGVVQAHGAGFGGTGDVLRRRFAQVRIGPFVLPEVEVEAYLGEAGDFGRGERANIGNRLLARFARVTLDYERRLAALDP